MAPRVSRAVLARPQHALARLRSPTSTSTRSGSSVDGSGTVNVTGPARAVDRVQGLPLDESDPDAMKQAARELFERSGLEVKRVTRHDAARPPLPVRLGGLQGREPHLLHPRLPRPAGGAAARGRAAACSTAAGSGRSRPCPAGERRPRGPDGRALPPAEQGLRPPARRRRGRARQHPGLAAGDGAGPRRRASRVRRRDGRAEHPLLDGDAVRGRGGPGGRSSSRSALWAVVRQGRKDLARPA